MSEKILILETLQLMMSLNLSKDFKTEHKDIFYSCNNMFEKIIPLDVEGFTDELKLSRICPISKKGTEVILKAISIFISKIMETIVHS